MSGVRDWPGRRHVETLRHWPEGARELRESRAISEIERAYGDLIALLRNAVRG